MRLAFSSSNSLVKPPFPWYGRGLSVMKMKIHDAPMKDECCYLVVAVLLTCLLDDTNTVLLTCLDYGIGMIQDREFNRRPTCNSIGNY